MTSKSPNKKIKTPTTLKEFLNPDRILLAILTKTRRNLITRAAILFTKIGNGQIYLLFSLCVMIVNIPIGLSFFIASLFQLYAQIFIKNLFKRTRPYHIYQDLEYLYEPPDPYSFPSGHTCAAFTMFFVANMIFPSIAIYFFILAVGIALSRVYLAVHYPSDVIGGVLVAYFSAKQGIAFSSLVTGTML